LFAILTREDIMFLRPFYQKELTPEKERELKEMAQRVLQLDDGFLETKAGERWLKRLVKHTRKLVLQRGLS
jgi:hypothetical protein